MTIGTKVRWLDIIGGKIASLSGEITGKVWEGMVSVEGTELISQKQYRSIVSISQLTILENDTIKQS